MAASIPSDTNKRLTLISEQWLLNSCVVFTDASSDILAAFLSFKLISAYRFSSLKPASASSIIVGSTFTSFCPNNGAKSFADIDEACIFPLAFSDFLSMSPPMVQNDAASLSISTLVSGITKAKSFISNV